MKRTIIAALCALTATTSYASERDTAWQKYTKWAYYQSQAQLGKAKQDRVCSKTTKTCTLAIYYFDKAKKLTLAIDVYDLDDKLIKRQVCRFNDAKDVRTCVDWDTGTTTKEIFEKEQWWIVED